MALSIELRDDINMIIVAHGENLENEIFNGLSNLFSMRYLPYKKLSKIREPSINTLARIKWYKSNKFNVRGYSLSETIDHFEIDSPPPVPYSNESPYFFLLQVMARQYAKKGLILFTDSVAIYDPSTERVLLVLGFPHGGKSTIALLSLIQGLIPLSTENTVIEVDRQGVMRIISGTQVLVADPKLLKHYSIKVELEADETTKHGYMVINLARRINMDKYLYKPVNCIYLVHCSFSSKGASLEPLVGRKITKTLWHFASSLLRGLDYYEPYPIVVSDGRLDQMISDKLRLVAQYYSGRLYEAFGSHTDVLKAMLSKDFCA
ncbi:MAG: hypothetical protein ABWW69_06305 [Pyrodictiaceae archaeon]